MKVIVDFVNDTPTVFLTWLDFVKLFLLNMEIILWSSSLAAFVTLNGHSIHSF